NKDDTCWFHDGFLPIVGEARHERYKPGFFWFANGLLLAAACLYRKCLMPKMITEKAFPSSHLMQILIEIQRVLAGQWPGLMPERVRRASRRLVQETKPTRQA
ncbi:MAG: hypothetical protein WA592_17985, partial [Pseudolabrys sp.]